MRKSNPEVVFLKDVENRNPVFAGRFHTNVRTVIFSKPITQLIQSFGKGRKASLFIFSTSVGIGNTDTSINPSFVNIKTTTIITNDLKR